MRLPSQHGPEQDAAADGQAAVAGRAAAAFAALTQARLRAALVGSGIGESRTPHMHMAEGARLGLGYAYGLVDFDALGLPESAIGAVLALAARHGLAGINVTHPFKQSIIPHLDGLSPEAAGIGAVNTVVFREGRAIGHNTDGWGFAESFRRGMQGAPSGSVLLVGAGGAGKAVGWALLELGVERVAIADLEPARATGLADSLSARFGVGRAEAVRDIAGAVRAADGLVNTTPVGMAKYPGLPVPAESLRRELWVADAVYVPVMTALLDAAAALGCRILTGRGMAIFQAVAAFQLITGHAPDPDAMARHFEAAVAPRN